MKIAWITKMRLVDNGFMLLDIGMGTGELIELEKQTFETHSSIWMEKMIEEDGFNLISVEIVEFPIIHSDILRKKKPIFGKSCIIESEKVPERRTLG